LIKGKIIINELTPFTGYVESNLDLFPSFFQEKAEKKLIHYHFNKNTQFFLVGTESPDKLDIILLKDISETGIITRRYFSSYADFLYQTTEELLPNGNIKRQFKNFYIIMNPTDIISINRKILFKPIKCDTSIQTAPLPDINIGTIDLETYRDNDGVDRCYAIGFLTNDDNGIPNTYYIDKDLDSVKLIQACISKMMSFKYRKFTFYSHNLGGYDAPYIVKSLVLYNKTLPAKSNDFYYFDGSVVRNKKIIKLVIKRKIENKIVTINIHDSLAILPGSLRNLCIDYELDDIDKKGDFPHPFANSDTLFYIGKTPDIHYYKDLVSVSEINNLTEHEAFKLLKDRYDLLYKEV
jgi:hypothetical protein